MQDKDRGCKALCPFFVDVAGEILGGHKLFLAKERYIWYNKRDIYYGGAPYERKERIQKLC